MALTHRPFEPTPDSPEYEEFDEVVFSHGYHLTSTIKSSLLTLSLQDVQVSALQLK